MSVGATGTYRIFITIKDLQAMQVAEKASSAIVIAARAIADLDHNGWHGQMQKGDKSGTSNVGFIHGGEATSVVTDLVELRVGAQPRCRVSQNDVRCN